MKIFKLGLLLSGLFIYTACKKEGSTSTATNTTTTTPETCVSGRAVSTVIEGRYIVELKNTSTLRQASERTVADFSRSFLQRQGVEASALRAVFNGGLNGFVADLSLKEITRLQASDEVEAIEPDRVVALGTCFTVVAPSLLTWNVTKTGYGDGTGKTAWIIDTGIDLDHPDLNVDLARSRSFLSGSTSADDENGHGTHVAGIIGGKNNDIGVLGVASGASLVSLRVLDKDGNGSGSGILQALSYVSTNAKAGDVVNMSLGEDTVSNILDNAVKSIAAKGIYVAIAAGNDSKAANLSSPARANAANIYTVSAVDSLNRFASFSNYGNDVVDFAASGVRIVSTYMGGKYARMSGTSMAAPHVAGLLLLVGGNIKSSEEALNDPDGVPDKIASK